MEDDDLRIAVSLVPGAQLLGNVLVLLKEEKKLVEEVACLACLI